MGRGSTIPAGLGLRQCSTPQRAHVVGGEAVSRSPQLEQNLTAAM